MTIWQYRIALLLRGNDVKNISAIVMAAGQSRRMGVNKLSLSYAGKPLIQHTLNLIGEIGFIETILVISPENSREILQLDIPKKARIVYNTYQERGLSYTVRLGVREAIGEGYLFFTGDQPLLTTELIAEIIDNATTGRIVFPLNENDDPSCPTFFGKDFREELLIGEGDEGGRQIRRRYPHACYSFIPENTKQLKDIDTPEDFENLSTEKEILYG
jgi:molybdenum cofactor cytidylyltransferase